MANETNFPPNWGKAPITQALIDVAVGILSGPGCPFRVKSGVSLIQSQQQVEVDWDTVKAQAKDFAMWAAWEGRYGDTQ